MMYRLVPVHHQIAAVIVAVTQDARLSGELGGDRRELPAEHRALRLRQRGAAEALDEVLREEVELPGQLFDVKGDAIREIRVLDQLRTAALERFDELDRLAVEGGVFRRGRRAQVRLQRDVTEIFERQDAERIRMAQDRGHGEGQQPQQLGDVGKRQRRERNRGGVERQND